MRRTISVFLMLCVVLVLPHESMAKAKGKTAEKPNEKYAAIIVDAATGTVLHEKNANRPLHPASLTKVMTLLLLFDALESGTVRLNDKILISEHAANQQPSKLGLSAGSSIRVEDAILAVVTKSANDIATAIGEYLGGSESRFAMRMTRRAQDIGMTKTNFVNASGLHDSRQISSARDMAILARYIIVRYPNYYRYFATKQFTYRGKTMVNHNRLMQSYPGMDGFKTGFVNASGFNLIASARRDNQRLIGVVFGGKSWKSRNDRMAELLNDGFAKMGDTRYANAVPGSNPPVPVVPVASANPVPPPPQKPAAAQSVAVMEARAPQTAPTAGADFMSLSSLDANRKVAVQPQADQVLKAPEDDVTERAVANVSTALNRGDYSEITGEGDYDAATTRRVEAGLLAAAVYKGEHEKVQQMQQVSAAGAQQLRVPDNQATAPASDLWSVQIGAYTSKVATDDALHIAKNRLPGGLKHASPLVVPLSTGEGLLFRARLGGFSEQQAVEACRYFKDCLPIAPR